MGEEDLLNFGPVEDKMQGIIKVIGIGGGGGNAVQNMYDEGVAGVTFAACNTDSQSLSRLSVPVKILLGETGLGAGGKPEVGRQEAENSIPNIERLLSDGTKMVFLAAGMGSGTGTGATPVIASIAKKLGLLTVAVVTLPFYFEKKRKIIKALKGIDELRKHVDALLIVNNERLCDEYADGDTPLGDAFRQADNVLMDAVKGIAELITRPSDRGIKSDFCDVESTVKDGGGAIMAMGQANGSNRVEKAILNALDSPLLYGNDIGKAKRILFNICASTEYPVLMREVQEIDDFFEQLDSDIEVIWGTSTDDSLGEDAKVTILATGLEDDLKMAVEANANQTEEDIYEELIPKLYKPARKKKVVEVFAQEPSFVVEPAAEPEPPMGGDAGNTTKEPKDPEPKVENPDEPTGTNNGATIVNRLGSWLTQKMNELAE